MVAHQPGIDAGAIVRPSDPARRFVIAASLMILTGLAWAWTITAAAMPACHTLALAPFVVMWTVMMAAMMFPSVIPVVLAFATLARHRARSVTAAAAVFVGGYLVVWALLGVPVHAATVAIAELVAASPALTAAATATSGAALIACGLYQLTPLKDACLRHCRVPHLFLGHHWRDGIGGAFVLGAHHALYCAGCCAAIMLVLLIVGMMNLTWMVALSLLIYLEKVLPGGMLIGRAAGFALCAAGIARVLA